MDGPNIQQAVPFFMVADIQASLRFYTEGLGAKMTKSWTPEGKIRWCWLELGCTALMLQEYNPGKAPAEQRGLGVSVCFQCQDAVALYKQFLAAAARKGAAHMFDTQKLCHLSLKLNGICVRHTSKAAATICG